MKMPEYRITVLGEIVATSSTIEGARRRAKKVANQSDSRAYIESWSVVDSVDPKPKPDIAAK